MHELSLAAAILEIALEHARGRAVRGIHLKVGYLRQVVPTALEFGFELVARDTPAAGARLEIESIPVEAVCRQCGAHSRLEEFPLLCHACMSADLQLTSGEELLVESLDLEEREEPEDERSAAPGEDDGGEGHPGRE